MTVGILYIALGKYDIFWKDFYLSAEEYFLPGIKKKYYVFTDSENLFAKDNDNIDVIYTKDMGWPYDTLMRFSMFLSIKDQLVSNEYLFFFNANLLFVDTIDCSFLPDEDNLLMAIHPGYCSQANMRKIPLCRDKRSTAYVPYSTEVKYVQGALNGGKTLEYLYLVEELSKNIENDLKRGVIARFHDESHLNKYVIGRGDVKYVGPEYIYPEGWSIPVEKIYILSRDKSKYFEVDKIKKGNFRSFLSRLVEFVKGNI